MRCRKVEKRLMEYVDGELDAASRNEIMQHLNTCDQCKRSEEALREAAIGPLNTAERVKAPESIWAKIKGEIAGQTARGRLSELIESLCVRFRIKQISLAVVTAAACILIAVISIKLHTGGRQAINTYIEDQANFFYYLAGENGTYYPNMDNTDLGTEIEKYLL